MPDYMLHKVTNTVSPIVSICVDKYDTVFTSTGGSMIKVYMKEGETSFTQLGCNFHNMVYEPNGHGLIIVDKSKNSRIVYLRLSSPTNKYIEWITLISDKSNNSDNAFHRLCDIDNIAFDSGSYCLYATAKGITRVYDLNDRIMRGILTMSNNGEIVVTNLNKSINKVQSSLIHIGDNGYLYIISNQGDLQAVIDGSIHVDICNIGSLDGISSFLLEGNDSILITKNSSVSRVGINDRKMKQICEVHHKVIFTCMTKDSKGNIHLGANSAYYRLLDKWFLQRLLWIGRIKGTRSEGCLLSILPKDMIREISKFI